MAKDKVVATITEKELRAFNGAGACQSACKKIVMEVMKHFELADIEQSELWSAVVKKYSLPDGKDYQLRGRTVFEIDSDQKLAQEFIQKMEARIEIRKAVLGAFELS